MNAWLRRHRGSAVIGLALLLAVTVAILGGNDDRFTDRIDPENRQPDGARALARVLADQGIDVRVARSAAEFDRLPIGAGTTVVVTSTENLGSRSIDGLVHHLGAADLVLADPPPGVLRRIEVAEGLRTRPAAAIGAGCTDPRFADLTIQVEVATVFPGPGCFPTPNGNVLAEPRPATAVLGGAGLFRNDRITRADNAAFALRLLGQRPHLVWYVASVDDLVGSDGVSLGSLLPDWLVPALWLAALSVLALALARGRRFGPLVTEPLPVAVTAIEGTESRGRLYRKVNDRAHAAGVLRAAARRRIGEHLRLPTAATPAELVLAVAAQTGSAPERVADLLSPTTTAPRTDKDLTRLARDLAELEKEVRSR